jgi:large subunit ribosomal protein L21
MVALAVPQPISADIMFAVIRTGGKQYRVAKDDVITVEKLAAEAGDAIEFGEVLMVADGAEVATGAPLLAGAAVSATVVEQRRGPKIIVFKKKRRHNYRRKKGHRQYETVVQIDEIRAAGFVPVMEETNAVGEEWPAAAEGPAVEAESEIETAPAVEDGSMIEAEPAPEQDPAKEQGQQNGS